MPEFIAEPAVSANGNFRGGDGKFTDNDSQPQAEVAGASDLVNEFGFDDQKTPESWGMVMHYDTSSIPLGAVANRTLLEMVASANQSGDFTVLIDVLGITARNRPGQVIEQAHEAQFRYFPDKGIFPRDTMWDDENLQGSDTLFLTQYRSLLTGLGPLSQTWIANSTAGLHVHYWRLRRTGTASGDTVRSNIWTVRGSDGVYFKDTLIDTGDTVTFDSLPTSFASPTGLQTSLFGGGGGVPLTSGVRYVSELEWIKDGGDGATTLDAAYGKEPNDAVDNLSVYREGSRVLDGFWGRTQWLDGLAIEAAPIAGTTDSIAAPGFFVDTLHSFGNAGVAPVGYDPDTALPNLLANIQAALDARTSTDQWLAIRFMDFDGVTPGRLRQVYSHRDVTTTNGSLRGPVLTIDWDRNILVKATTRAFPAVLASRRSGLSVSARSRAFAAVSATARVGVAVSASTRARPAVTATARTDC